jgi:cytochrome c553
MKIMKKSITLIVAGSMWALAAIAQVPAWNDIKGELKMALEAKGDAKRGEVAFEQCTGCHRNDGSGRVSGAYPRLSGQHVSVLIKQIVDIRSGQRLNPKMEPFLGDHGLTPYDIADVSVYINSLPITTANGRGTGKLLDKGKQLFDRDCAVCHGAKGEGDSVKFYPMVAAQHFKYLQREVTYIRDGDRRNSNPDMVKVIKSYTPTDIEAVSDFMASLAPPIK